VRINDAEGDAWVQKGWGYEMSGSPCLNGPLRTC